MLARLLPEHFGILEDIFLVSLALLTALVGLVALLFLLGK